MSNWKAGIDYPEWMEDISLKTLQGGYLLEGETPKQMYERVAKSVAFYLKKPELEKKFFDLMWENKLCPASPILSNSGTDRGLPISCNSIHPDDSVTSIFDKNTELAVLSKNGAGVGIYMGDIRHRGAHIKGNGKSEGIAPWCTLYDKTASVVSQGATRRGAAAVYLPIEHPDLLEFLNIRRPTGDINTRCPNIHHAVCISDEFMEKVKAGDEEARHKLIEVYKTRFETGEPYIFYSDNVNKYNPKAYVNNNLTVKTSNICSEITLYTDPDHSFVCCLSSLNLARWNDITDDDIYYSIYFLDGVLTEYIEKASKIEGMEAAVRSAIKGRAVGLGVLGWHTLLQSEGTAFGSFRSTLLNKGIFAKIEQNVKRASSDLALEYGEPEWCKGTGMRNTHLMAVAPTQSNSIISGNVSSGIEPISANAYIKKTAKGTFIQQNKHLKVILQSLGKDTQEVWTSIATNDGSVQHLDFLSDEQKQVFLTAYEINQFDVIKLAADRQKFIDQAQSLNLFFPANVSPQYFHDVHWLAWELGVKTLYYVRTGTVIKGDIASRSQDDSACLACES
jgi:ribonucleoside-diphosphate reductase alpha chain